MKKYLKKAMAFLTGWRNTETWAVFAEAWKVQNEAGQPIKRTENEREFLPAVLEVQEKPVSRIAVRAGRVILVCMAIGLLWAALAPRPIHVVMTGKTLPLGHVQVIEPLESATVKTVHIRNGDMVTKGDALITFNPTEIMADHGRLTRELETAQSDVLRLQITLNALAYNLVPDLSLFDAISEPVRQQQKNFLNSTLAAHKAETEALASDEKRYREQVKKFTRLLIEREKSVSAVHSRLHRLEKAYNSAQIVHVRFLEVQQEAATIEGELINTQGGLEESQEAVLGIAHKRNEMLEKALVHLHHELADAQSRQRSVEQELTKVEQRRLRSHLTAPISGIVANLKVHTAGDVVQTGERLMEIVPQDALVEIEALMKNRDRADVWAGQQVRVKVEAFPFTRYGVLTGEIVYIGADAVEVPNQGLMFPVRTKLIQQSIQGNQGQYVQIGSGMAVTVEAQASSQTVLEYLFTPLARIADEAFRER